ncbi:hypothetical protein QR680_005337 [Steinernema hermaphroditum]|uniref:NTR domain-containing protein n=1 Tax=Steinernema hermaphroditum TaxID=289476 RepID=A0AA39HRM5_9BILA|nr:hypothetical protein QR680_005337 [Steinernema hermaphroditum]
MHFTLICLLFPLGFSFACDCFPRSDGELFCAANWVSIVKVLSSSVDPNEENHRVFYNVSAAEIFKGPLAKGKEVVLETARSSAACGLESLEEGREYLLLGKNKKLNANICGQLGTSVSEWKDVSVEIKENLEREHYECGKKL